MEYNTKRVQLVMREYGRHIQRMVNHLLTLEDREQRQQQAYVLIELMGFLNPHLKNVEDFRHKLWDHLFFISDFQLDVDSPYPIPTRETYKLRPEPLPYPKGHPKYSHLGKNLEGIVNKALAEENPEKKQGFANTIAYYMKLAYNNWHKENIHDDTIRAEMNEITDGQLEFTNTPYVRYYRPSDSNERETRSGNNGNRGNRPFNRQMAGGGNNGNRKNNNNNRNNGGNGNGNRNNNNNNRNSGGGGNRNTNFKKRY